MPAIIIIIIFYMNCTYFTSDSGETLRTVTWNGSITVLNAMPTILTLKVSFTLLICNQKFNCSLVEASAQKGSFLRGCLLKNRGSQCITYGNLKTRLVFFEIRNDCLQWSKCRSRSYIFTKLLGQNPYALSI